MVDTKMTKSTGEHWVCSMLSRLGWGVALTRDGLERTDILAVRVTGARSIIEVQVKSANIVGPEVSWPIGPKAQTPALHDREWFVMVAIPAELAEPPEAFVVPRDVIAAAAWIEHQHWLTEPGIPPGRRNVDHTRARLTRSAIAGYESRWDLLEAPASAAPVLLPRQYRDYALSERVGLPESHPWRESLPSWG